MAVLPAAVMLRTKPVITVVFVSLIAVPVKAAQLVAEALAAAQSATLAPVQRTV